MIPRYITCERCGAVKQVRKPSEQRQRFCSRKCSAIVTMNIRHAASSKGGLMRAHRVRMQILQRINGLSPLQAFRQGYRLGVEKRRRQYRKRMATCAA